MLMQSTKPLAELENASEFIARHIGIDEADEALMLKVVGSSSRRELIEGIVPRAIARTQPMDIPAAISEAAALAELKAMASKNKVFKSFIGQGYHGTHTPGVILRNVLENPAWYTAYTPYQAEISQGRMEALINFQTMVCELTGMAIAGSSDGAGYDQPGAGDEEAPVDRQPEPTGRGTTLPRGRLGIDP